jgi:hypothetical protein
MQSGASTIKRSVRARKQTGKGQPECGRLCT